MGRYIILLFLTSVVALSFDNEPRPVVVQNSRLAVAIQGMPSPGYFLIGSVDGDSVGLIDNAGVLVHTSQTGPTVNITLTPYGGITFYHGRLGKYVLYDDKLRAIDTFGVEPPYTTDFHEGYQTRGRRYIVLGTEERAVDMSTLVAGGLYDAFVIGAVVQEFDRYGRKTFEWKSLDHISPLEATPDVDLTNKRIDYIHVNSVVEDNDRNFIISCRNLDQVLKISRASGDIIWRLGGSSAAKSDFAILNDDNSGFHGFSHQHTAIRSRNGEIVLFDNGNLRPVPFSRAVAYRLDEEQKTATKTWEYISREMQISTTMGSVQELPNGNVLIGWGNTPTGLVASEVDRSGVLHAEITTLTTIPVPYRVRKSPVAMTAVSRTIDTLGRFTFANFDSTTRISVDVTSLTAPTTITVEKHSYYPHNQEFTTQIPCNIYPLRWVVQVSDTGAVSGNLAFDLSRLTGSVDPSDVVMYYRPNENSGSFDTLTNTLISGTPIRLVPHIRSGEYMIATHYCAQPTLRVPNNNSIVGGSVTMEWTEALGADGYEIEVSEDPAFANDSWLFRTQYNDTTLSGFTPGTTYHWRVRVIRQPEVGPWTLPWSFTIPQTSSVELDQHQEVVTLRGTLLDVVQSISPKQIDLYDLTGRRALSMTNPQLVDIAHLPIGPYIVVCTSASGAQYRKLIAR